MCVFVLGIFEYKVCVVVFDVGGGFGSKIFYYIEEVLVIWVLCEIKCFIKWMFDCLEVFMMDVYGCDYVIKVEMGFDVDGNIVVL